MSYPARGPKLGIDGKANAAGHRRVELQSIGMVAEVAV